MSVHRLSIEGFCALARTEGDSETIRTLMAGQRSRRVLLLREVVTESARHPDSAGAARLGQSVSDLDHLQRQHPEAAREVLGYPLVGAWAAHCLRRMRSSRVLEGEGPLWVDLAHLNAIVGAIAIRAGSPVDVEIPLRGGRAALPGLGAADLVSHARYGVARLRDEGRGYVLEGRHGRIPVPATGLGTGTGLGTSSGVGTGVGMGTGAGTFSGWMPLMTSQFEVAGKRLTIVLDDVDPYRDCHGLTTADRLNADQVQRWCELLDLAWRLLCDQHPQRADELSAVPVVLVPLESAEGGPGVNATARDSTGAIAMSPPVDGVDLSQSVVHEFQHSKLGALLDLVELYDPQDRRRFYSPWRPDPRPLSGLLQGAYAFLSVAAFWRGHLEAGNEPNVALSQYKLARSREQLRSAVRTLQESGALTEPGRLFVAELREASEDVHALPLPEEALVRATVVNEHHRISWRLRNRHPGRQAVHAQVGAFLEGRPPDGQLMDGGGVSTAAPRYDEEPLDELARLDMTDLLTRTRSVRNRLTPTGDLALLHRDYEAASAAYLEEIAVDPEPVFAWAGLALARQYGPGPTGPVYRAHPEMVAAVFRELWRRLGPSTPPPDAVARWLAQ